MVIDNDFSALDAMAAFACGLIVSLGLMAAAVARIIDAVGTSSKIAVKFGVCV